MKRLTIIGLWPDDVVKYCAEKCDCRRYAFDRILYHRGGRDARERICIPVVDRSGAVTTYLDLPVLFLEAIAIPPWKWVLKRLCAIYERDATMASLFDGIGGFPYIWEQLNGKGSCLWASEIEPFPIAVTKYHFGEE